MGIDAPVVDAGDDDMPMKIGEVTQQAGVSVRAALLRRTGHPVARTDPCRPVLTMPEITPERVKPCCAAAYDDDLVALVLGEVSARRLPARIGCAGQAR